MKMKNILNLAVKWFDEKRQLSDKPVTLKEVENDMSNL